MPGKPSKASLLEAGLAGLADGRPAAFVLVVRGDVADAGVEPDAVVVRPGDLQFGAQGCRVPDREQVRVLGLEVSVQALRSRPGRSVSRAGRSAGRSRTGP